eukprot:scaffold3294_cov10700-Pavlova_lutheri.AAC.2
MVRSPGFGSIKSDKIALFRLAFALASTVCLNQATPYKSPAHSSTGTRGFFSPFPRGTSTLSVTQEYLALRGGPRRFTRDFTCPMLLGISN